MENKPIRATRRPGKKYVGIDLEDAVYDQLNTIAQTDRRPLTSLIRVILDQWLARWNDEQAKRSADVDETYAMGQSVIGAPAIRGVFSGPVTKGKPEEDSTRRDHRVGDLESSPQRLPIAAKKIEPEDDKS
jgi:predicted DNA-binding ribbon-helix-helix protein